MAIVAARRTPIGTAGHGLAGLTAADLAAATLDRGAGRPRLARGPTSPRSCSATASAPGGNLARVAALQAGLPVVVPALTVDRQCGSGLAAITVGAALLGARAAGVVLAGGVESASTAPWRFWPPVGRRAAGPLRAGTVRPGCARRPGHGPGR